MEEMKVKVTKDGRRWFNREHKEQIVKEVEGGANRGEVCRKYGITEQQFLKWRHALHTGSRNGLGSDSMVISRMQLQTLQKKVDELERALGRKSLEADILKKAFEIKGLKLPDGI
jgi:transposase